MKLKYFALYLLLVGCSTVYPPADFKYKSVNTDAFEFASWQKITDKNANYKIYIEGDGFSFNAYGMPTTDPTPRSTLVRDLAFGDKNPNVIYLARACQFIKSKNCAQKYWTTARFSAQIADAEAQAIKQIVGNKSVILIGFSGGAQIAALVAVRNPEISVSKIVTIAGNLDHSAWTAYHKVPPLAESLDLRDYYVAFKKITQIHYVGDKDEIIPPFLTYNFVTDKSAIIKVEGATHNRGWDKIMPQIQAEK